MSQRGQLVVVGTPLGNLGDLSDRAKDELRGADLILAEDTRHSRPLLDVIGATAKTVSCHQHNEEDRLSVVLERLDAGDRVALITDAGAPAVSDPGGKIVQGVVAAGGDVVVVPGPSAPIAALMGAGLETARFLFVGFLPRKGKSRTTALAAAAATGHAIILFEAANRTLATLDDLQTACGARRVVVARELTKKFETFHRGMLGGELTPPFTDKGEVVIVVDAGGLPTEGDTGPSVDERALALVQDASLSPRDRAKVLGAEFHLARKDAYRRILEAAEKTPDSGDAGPEDGTPVGVDTGVATEVLSQAPPPALSPEAPISSLAAARQAIAKRAVATGPARQRMQAALKDASRALLEAYAIAGGQASLDDADTATSLMKMLNGPRRLPAPAEAEELLRALLAANGAAEALDEAIEMMSESMGDDG